MSAEVAPEISAKLDGAIAGLAEMEAQSSDLALAVVQKKPGAEKALVAHRSRIKEAEAAVGELRFLLSVAEKADARSAADQRHRQRLTELNELEKVAKAKQRSVEIYCRAVEVAAKAYLDILDTSFQMEGWLPSGTNLARYGLTPHSAEALILDGSGNVVSCPTSTESIAAAEMQRYARVTRVGNSGAMPGARALTPAVIQNPDAVEPWASSNERLTLTMIAHLKSQIETLHQRELAETETHDNAKAA
jgi:hypothetical protein